MGTRWRVDTKSNVSGVQLCVIFRGEKPDNIKEALRSFFSHAGANSYWKAQNNEKGFVLSQKFQANKIDSNFWADRLSSLVDEIVARHNDTPEQIEALKPTPMLYWALKSSNAVSCARLLEGLYDHQTVNQIMRAEKSPVVKLADLKGENLKLAQELCDNNTVRLPNREALAKQPKQLEFRMKGEADEITKMLWIRIPTESEYAADRSCIGNFGEETAKEYLRSVWATEGDIALRTDIPYQDRKPATKTITTRPGNVAEKITAMSEHFKMSVIAILPTNLVNTIPPKEIDVFTISTAVASLSKGYEPILAKQRGNVLMICPASFFAERGVSSTVPLATQRALAAVAAQNKDGVVDVVDAAAITSALKSEQLESPNEYAVMLAVSKWRQILRATPRQAGVREALLAGDAVSVDNDMRIALDRMARENAGTKPKLPGGALRLQITESSKPFPTAVEALAEMPKDYLLLRTVTLKITDAAGKAVREYESEYAHLNPKYRDGIPTPKPASLKSPALVSRP